VLVVLAAAVVVAGCGGSDEPAQEANLQTVSFQEPEDPGPDPFTRPADVEGDEEVDLPASGGQQPLAVADPTGSAIATS
jgi:hypothetical protein